MTAHNLADLQKLMRHQWLKQNYKIYYKESILGTVLFSAKSKIELISLGVVAKGCWQIYFLNKNSKGILSLLFQDFSLWSSPGK
jgi:hypothetical protein